MKNLCFFAVVSALCVITTGRPGSGGSHTTCTTSGIVLEGSPAEVTCDFHNDLGQVDGIFYADKTTTKEAVIIAICSWKGVDPDCRLTDDFVLKNATHDGRVTFGVPSAKQKHSGHYKCKTLPAQEASADACTLTVQKNEIIGSNTVTCHTSSPVQMGEDASLLCMFPKTIGITGVTLKKYNPENKDTEEIVRCDKDQDCQVQKAGYEVDQKTDSYLRVSIPRATQDKAGIYMCRSTLIQQESGTCALSLTSDDTKTKASPLKQIIYPLYAILACFLLLIVLGLVAVFQRFSFFCSRRSPMKTKENSQESLMDGVQKPHAYLQKS